MKLGNGRARVVLGMALLTLAMAFTSRDQARMSSEGAAKSAAAASESERTPVVVELFTSEGCSSCPLADALLARLDKTQPVPGVEIVALKEHVDYWNHQGWKDPFSSAQFSERQNAYARVFGNDTVYTPQMVVDGRMEFVGSAEDRARQAILEAARMPKAPVQLEWDRSAVQLRLAARIERLDGATRGDTPEVYLAITEGNLHSDVLRGENAGRRLDHTAVVRELRRIGSANLGAVPVFAAQPKVIFAPGWKREDLRAVVFVQEQRSRRVLAVAAVAAAAP
jgi:hypothetical protein